MKIEQLFQPEDFNAEPKISEDQPELIKDKTCIRCRNMIGCKGKLRGVFNCLGYDERDDINDNSR